MTKDPWRQDVQPFGCIVTQGTDNPDRIPWAAVFGGATDDQCARFEFIREGDFNSNEYRFKELYVIFFLSPLFIFTIRCSITRSTGKLMVHRGDWIWLDAEPDDKTANTLFIKEDYVFWNDKARNPVLRPSSSSNPGYAQYISGDLNTKNSEFRMFVSLVQDTP